jgi:hypothetical protein
MRRPRRMVIPQGDGKSLWLRSFRTVEEFRLLAFVPARDEPPPIGLRSGPVKWTTPPYQSPGSRPQMQRRPKEMHTQNRRSSLRLVRLLLPAIVAVTAFAPNLAHAYIGPGAGLTAIGTVLALLAAVLFAVVGFVWYPMKRLLKRLKAKPSAAEPDRVRE